MAKAEPRPKARERELVVRELADEVLVYDLERYKAHCLGPLSAEIWRACNGRRTVAEIARGRGVEEPLARVTLRRLQRAGLLESAPAIPSSPGRREWIKKAATLGGLTVLSVTVPTAAFAISCISDFVCCGTRQVAGVCPASVNNKRCCTSQTACTSGGNGSCCGCSGSTGTAANCNTHTC